MTDRPVIHVGLDASWRGSGALEWALQEADLRGTPLRVVHVIEEKLRHTPYWEPAVIDDAAAQVVKEVQEHVKDRDTDLEFSAELAAGHPATVLAEESKDSQLLVVGRRGAGSFTRLLIGSTSEAVCNQAQVPVVVVPDGWTPPETPSPIVVGLDESDDNASAVDFGARLAAERGVPLRLVHVWEIPEVYGWSSLDVVQLDTDWDIEAVARRFELIGQQWRDKYPEVQIEVVVQEGHPVYGLLDVAEAVDAQLIVVGGRSHHPLVAILLGSVTRGVLHHATRPVAVVHQPRRRS